MNLHIHSFSGPTWLGRQLRSLDGEAAFILRHRWVVYYTVLLVYVLTVAACFTSPGFRSGVKKFFLSPAPAAREMQMIPPGLAEVWIESPAAQAWATGVQ